MIRRSLSTLAVLVVLGTAVGGAVAAPGDPTPGQVRSVMSPQGAQLRGTPQVLGAVVARLPYGAQVVVQEVRLPWIRVSTVATRTQPAQGGWLRAAETVLPGQLGARQPTGPTGPPPPPGGSGGVSARDVSAAGRQWDAGTEGGYRGLHPDIDRAYPLVDQMERDSWAIDAATVQAFVQAGRFANGKAVRPDPLMAPQTAQTQQPQGRPQPQRPATGPFGLPLPGLDDLARRAGRELGGERTGEILGGLAKTAIDYTSELRKQFTPEQEYYLGRAIAANAIAKFGIDPDANRRRYVQTIGQALVRTSTRLLPTFRGYHFDVLNTDEVNGISGPGGYVLVTRGAVMNCKSEDELAGILAHELSHIRLKHGEQTIRQGSSFQAGLNGLANVGATATGLDDPRWRQQLLNLFDQVVTEAARTSQEHAYGKGAEFQSDVEGSYVLVDVGLDTWAIRDSLRNLAATGHHHGGATHAPPGERAQNLDGQLAQYGAYPYGPAKAVRLQRFQATLGIR